MSNQAALTSTTNIVPVQGIFEPAPTFDLITLIGPAGTPFFAKINPYQSGLHITDSTIDSTTIGATTPSTATFTSAAVLNAPLAPTDITNKQSVDYLAAGLSWKPPVNAASLGSNLTLSGTQTVDGVALAVGDTILVKNQTAPAENGIYVVAAGAWSRAVGADTWNEYLGAIVFVLSGSQADSAWYCTAQPGGTLGTTALNWANFSVSSTYSAGTGLTLSGTQFSITPVGTAGTYGSASAVPVFVTNTLGQVTSVTNTNIAIGATQITSGTIDSARLTGSYSGITGVGTLTNLTVTNTISGSINGNAATATTATTATTADKVANSLTINNGGLGASSGATFDGSSAITISYNTVGAPSTSGTNATGTWGISISGNAATATSAGSSTTATNLAGGAAGSVPYQSGAGATAFLAAGTTGQVLSTNGASAPSWIGPSAFLDNITTTQGSLIYRNAASWVNLSPGTANYLLQTGGAGANPSWVNPATLSVSSASTATTATNLAGGGAGFIPYQSGAGTTAFLSAGTSGQVLQSNGASAPTWVTPTAYATVTDDTTTNATRYPLFASVTTGNLTAEFTSSTKFQFNPSTGALTTTSLTPTNALGIAYGGTGATTLAGASIVTYTGTESLSNKTLTNPTVTNYVESVVAIGTVTTSNTLSLTNGTVQTATLTASTACTFTMPTATAGKSFVLLLKQAASTGNGSATFTSVKWGTAGAPTITATAGKMDILTFIADGTNWYGSAAQGYTP